MSQSEENQNGCCKPRRNADEGIGSILEDLGAYICDEICQYREKATSQEALEYYFCDSCKVKEHTEIIKAEYDRINSFGQSEAWKLMEKYRKIILCKDCRYRTLSGDGEKAYCTLNAHPEQIHEGYGCSWGME